MPVERSSVPPVAHPGRALSATRLLGLLVGASLGAIVLAVSATGAPAPRAARVHFACSKPTSGKIPCYFTTPSRNVRCVWAPRTQDVKCVRVANWQGFLLRPTGRAQRLRMRVDHAAETLPLAQEIVFPQRLSCHDTRTSITCNQNEGSGFFTIGTRRSRGG